MIPKTAQFVAILIAFEVAVATGTAQEPLRWKFAADEWLETSIAQEMRLELDGPASKLATVAREELDITWRVRSVTLTRDAELVGKCDRVQASLADADEEGLQYDSASDEPAAGLAAMMAPLYEAILAGEFELTISPRGEVRDLRIPDDVAEQIRSSPGADATGPDAAVDAFSALVVAWVIELPAEPPASGQTWSTRVPVQVPDSTSATMVTEYRYDGTRDIGGRTLAVLRPTMILEVASADGSSPTVKDEHTSGAALFDIAAGRLDSLNIEHRATRGIAAEGQMREGTIEQRTEVSVRLKE
jgi:hypothetical protein